MAIRLLHTMIAAAALSTGLMSAAAQATEPRVEDYSGRVMALTQPLLLQVNAQGQLTLPPLTAPVLILLDGITFELGPNTIIETDDGITVGDELFVLFRHDAETLDPSVVHLAFFVGDEDDAGVRDDDDFEGVVEVFTGSTLTVSGVTFDMAGAILQTDNGLAVGDLVYVVYLVEQADNAIRLRAVYVEEFSEDDRSSDQSDDRSSDQSDDRSSDQSDDRSSDQSDDRSSDQSDDSGDDDDEDDDDSDDNDDDE